MTLNNIKTMKKERGFTIVELLIVIVVIGILAAIVIVAYTGVTNNAKDANDKANAVSITKVAEALNADKGWYPGGTGDTTTVTNPATLTTSFNAGPTSKLPAGITLKYIANGGTEPDVATAKADSDSKTYTVEVCGTTLGVTVFYASRATNTVLKQNAGTGC